MYRNLIICLLLLCICTSYGQEYARKNKHSKRIQLNNGQWFNGKTFEKKTVWVENGLLHFNKINHVDTVIDLSGKFVIPPFADAHNHNLESQYELQERIDKYLDNGVFYVKLLSTIKKRIAKVLHNYNEPSKIDVRMAHAPLTAQDGHPMGVRKLYLDRGYYRGMFDKLSDLEFHGFVLINNAQDLERKWDRVVASKPDFIKINLLYSEEYEKRKDSTQYFARKGLNPKLVPRIVQKAAEAGLKVSAHVETAHDFHVVVAAGVDEVAHLPEISHGKPIRREDAALARKKGIRVVTTASLVLKRQRRPDYQQLIENIKNNLQLLKEEGVTMAIGSDQYNGNSVEEFQFLYGLGVFSNLELLNMWTKNATEATFPRRKVGVLKEGYEASFLVLDTNPLINMDRINTHITMRIKQGILLK